ncbi:MAG: type II toxin-antitoxin system Phd/YefM family antitoxin [Propionibacteriaceae bacterium]|jgi:prevent-host-death family protein|nr:type II toxin-antitoxin system Phd/YefM family antitoxin [Propionibacteriaceae bacterium]
MAAWQVQEAKQRFSEVLRKVASEGDQIITKHGAEIAVVIDMDEYRRLRGLDQNRRADSLRALPKFEADDDEISVVLDQVIAERKLYPSGREFSFAD